MRNRERGFLEVERQNPGYRSREVRLKDYGEVERRFSDAKLREQAARCMDCGIPFCHSPYGCPVKNLIPEFNDLAYHGQWQEALKVLLAGGCFPEFTGRICPAPCEGACTCALNDEAVSIRQIELTIIEKGFEQGYIQPQPPLARLEQNVAIVGSGPAGLAAAQTLNRMGYSVVVYENSAYPGGLLRYGIPDFKLAKSVVERRINLMEAEGVVFETGVEIGSDVSYRYLSKRFDALILTGGAREPRDLKVPGRELNGIHFAMDFLRQQNMLLGGERVSPAERISAEGKDVVVIGGGDTGSDCIGTSWRQGAKSVHQLEILPRPPDERSEQSPWPMWPIQVRNTSSHQEGGERRWCVSTTSLEGDEADTVSRLNAVEVEWQTPKGGGRPNLVEKTGSEFSIDTQLVLLAMGFVAPGRNGIVDELGLELDGRGFISRVDGHMTSEAGVFVAGDMTQGASLVVRAIRDGQEAAWDCGKWFRSV